MNVKLFKLLTAGTFVLLSSCGDNIIDVPEPQPGPNTIGAESNPVQTKATLNVVVQDASTGKPIAATVRLLATGDTAIADSANGTAIFKNLSAGEYNMFIEAIGYAPVRTEAFIGSQISENIYIAQVAQAAAFLYPLTAKIAGTLYYTDKDGKKKPASGADIALIISPNTKIADSLTRKVKVGSDGKYAFSALPAVGSSSYRIVSLEYTTAEKTVYGAQDICNANCGALISGDALLRENYILSDRTIDEVFMVLSYSNYISDASNVVIAFSSPVDLNKFDPNDLRISSNYSTFAADFAWNATRDTLTIKPIGKWNGSFSVLSNRQLYSDNGKNLWLNNIDVTVKSVDLSIIKVERLLQSDSATTNYNTTGANIHWKKVQGATGYNIYMKKKSDLIYYLRTGPITNPTAVNDSIVSFGVSFGDLLNQDTIRFIIQAINGQSQTKLEGANELKVWDRVRPSVNLESRVSVNNTSQPYGLVRFGYDSDEDGVKDGWGLSSCNSVGLGSLCYYSTKQSYVYRLAQGIYNNNNYYGNATSFLYYSDVYSGTNVAGTGDHYWTSIPGLDSLQFGFRSDLAYYLSRTETQSNVISGCTRFNEPMDTTTTGTDAGQITRITVDKKWKDDQTLCFSFNVTGGTAYISGIDATYSVSGLKDKIGNELGIDYKDLNSAITALKNTLDFKIKSIGYTPYTPIP